MQNCAILIENLEYFYRHQWTGKKIRALHPFSLQITPGECFGFLGHNGAGKTTTIKALLGLIRPSSGKIELFAQDPKKSHSRKAIGYVPEQPYFYDHLSVREILEMYAGLSGVPHQERREAVQKTLKRLDLLDRQKTPMRSLSKGLIQRVAIAQAICHRPKLLILDEPFSGLDPLGRKDLRDLFMELKQQGTTIFMSSHILSDVESLCERASIMVKGNLKGVFNLRERRENAAMGIEITIQNPNSAQEQMLKQLDCSITSYPSAQRLSFSSRDKADAALKIILDQDIVLEKFESAHQSLESLFVNLVNESKTSP